ncbi:MAG TPA: LPS export ABC transporter periplasmic protein LptC [Mesorhizobium sp.]|jgi:lipopolysaccharide export system protein LptC
MLAGTISEQATRRAASPKQSASDAPRQRAFAIAQRHSKLVRALKIIVPVGAIAMAGAFVVASYLLTPVKVNVEADGSTFVDGKLVMANPKLEGVTKENRPYSLNAQRAIQDLKAQDLIELEHISAKLPINTKDWATIGASKGVYDRVANTLNVGQPFKVKTTEGMTAMLQSAFVDIAKGSLTTGDPVDIELKGGRVQAGSLSVLDKGNQLVFEKNVRVNIDATRVQSIRSSEGG